MRGGAGFAKFCGSLGWVLLSCKGLGGGVARVSGATTCVRVKFASVCV